MKVSACIIAYNHENYIIDCLEGALSQKVNFDYEIVIGEDKSTDATLKICEEYVSRYPDKIRLIKRDVNLGMMGNWTDTIKSCQGKYIAICEGDDYWTDPLKLQKQVDFLEVNPDYTFCVHRYKLYIENDKKFEEKIYPIHYESYTGFDHGIEIEKKVFAKDWFTQPLTAVIVREELKEVLKMQEHFHYFRDYHIFYFLLQRGKGICLENCAGVYRINDGGIASGKTSYEKIKIAFLIFEELYLYTKEAFFVFIFFICVFVFLKKN